MVTENDPDKKPAETKKNNNWAKHFGASETKNSLTISQKHVVDGSDNQIARRKFQDSSASSSPPPVKIRPKAAPDFIDRYAGALKILRAETNPKDKLRGVIARILLPFEENRPLSYSINSTITQECANDIYHLAEAAQGIAMAADKKDVLISSLREENFEALIARLLPSVQNPNFKGSHRALSRWRSTIGFGLHKLRYSVDSTP